MAEQVVLLCLIDDSKPHSLCAKEGAACGDPECSAYDGPAYDGGGSCPLCGRPVSWDATNCLCEMEEV